MKVEIKIPRGWLKLKPDECIQKHDRVASAGKWRVMIAFGFSPRTDCLGFTYIRRIARKAKR